MIAKTLTVIGLTAVSTKNGFGSVTPEVLTVELRLIDSSKNLSSFEIHTTDAQKVKVGQRVKVTIEGLNDD